MDWRGSHTGRPRGVNHSQGPKSSIAANNNPIQPSELDFTGSVTELTGFGISEEKSPNFSFQRQFLSQNYWGITVDEDDRNEKHVLYQKNQLKNFIDYQNLSHHSDPNLLNMSKMCFSFLQNSSHLHIIYSGCWHIISKSLHNFDMYKLGSDQNFQKQSFYNLSWNSKRNQLNVKSKWFLWSLSCKLQDQDLWHSHN